MNKTITIILNETTFEIEDEAYENLKEYLSQVEKYFSKEEAKDEIVKDIENNFASKLEEKILKRKQKIVLEKDVDDLIKIIGRVEDFESENKTDNNSNFSHKEEYNYRKLYRNPDDVVLAGVCSGLASYLGVEANIVRILFAIITVFTGFFPGFIIYFILWAIVPVAETGSQKLEMDGEIINLKNLKEKIYKMKDDIKKATMNENNRNYVKQKVKNFKKEIKDEFSKESNKQENALSLIIKIILIIIGVSFIASAISGFIGITVATSVILFIPNVISQFVNITGVPSNYIQIVSILGLLTALVPLIFILVAGVSLIKRRNGFRLGSSIFMLILWVFIISSLVFFSLRIIPYGPHIPSININTTQFKDYESVSTNETIFTLDDKFESIKVEGPYFIKIIKGENFAVKARGEDFALDNLKVYVSGSGELKISSKDIFSTILNNVAFEIELPDLKSIDLNGATKLDVSGFDNNENINIKLNGASFAKLNLYSKNINLELNGLSRVEFVENNLNLSKQVENIKAELDGASSADLLNIETKNADLILSGASNLKINVIDSLKIKVDGASSISYLGNPRMNQRITGASTVKKIEDIENENIENATSSF